MGISYTGKIGKIKGTRLLPPQAIEKHYPTTSVVQFIKDLYYYNTISLIQPLTDVTTYTVDEMGNAVSYYDTISYTSSGMFDGYGGITLNGSTNYVSLSAELNCSDWCVEAMVNIDASSPANFRIWDNRDTSWLGGFSLYCASDKWQISDSATIATSTENVSDYFGQDIHIVVTKIGSVVTFYIDGVEIMSGTSTTVAVNTNFRFGAVHNTEYPGVTFKGTLYSLRITKGYGRYTAGFTALTGPFDTTLSTESDPYWSDVMLLLTGDTTIQDVSMYSRTLSYNGSPSIDSGTYKTGTGSIDFDRDTLDFILCESNDLNLSNENFTIEGWLKRDADALADGTADGVFAKKIDGGALDGYICTINAASDTLWFGATSTGSSWDVSLESSSIGTDWTHIAIVRLDAEWVMYVNGTEVDRATADITVSSTDDAFTIGSGQETPATNNFKGKIDSFRVTKGHARYVRDFTPYDQSFPIA